MRSNDDTPMDALAAHLDRGWDLVARGDFAGARRAAEESLEIDEDAPEAYNLIGYISAAEGHVDVALDHYRRAIDLDDCFLEAMLNAAELLLHPLRDAQGALDLIDDALDLCETPDEHADALLMRVDALVQLGDDDGARAVLSALPEGPYEGEQVAFLIGRARFELGDLDAAEPLIHKAAASEVRNPDVFYYLGLVHDARGRTEDAAAAFLQARELDLGEPSPAWSLRKDEFEAQVQRAIRRLSRAQSAALEGALVVTEAVPGAEVVAEGVDPRVPVLLDAIEFDATPPRVGRVFVYQRNVERSALGPLEIEDEIRLTLEREIAALSAPPAPDEA
ncbi:MAG: tetratricopeptide repeat protein [Myxococcales bacterium]|nr:tetratricopeptide repeat protein [Myxococcales bacterium]